jgi:hypothetical protein
MTFLTSCLNVDGISVDYAPITYYWTVPLILDHPYLDGKLTSSKLAYTKVVRILEVLKLLF